MPTAQTMKQTLHDPLGWIDDALAELDDASLRRRLSTHEGQQGPRLRVCGREFVNFGSNDYLGLAADPRLLAAAQASAVEEGWGAGASPLVTGRAAAHGRLEQHLAAFEGTEAALLFPSGYAANVGAITALAGRGDAIYSDAKNHASLIDGCRLSGAEVHVYSHCDSRSLESLIDRGSGYRRRLIAT
ncbi:MAG TPA: aminotransferase class I/II-fold pyridoxal phosphate-dependent enzyme, partial [Pirellulales bacterium]|nr:aminotransferase class I/II-fold pyridoxal phosphate-dependent enzyme [Pirellulales bacterium]